PSTMTRSALSVLLPYTTLLRSDVGHAADNGRVDLVLGRRRGQREHIESGGYRLGCVQGHRARCRAGTSSPAPSDERGQGIRIRGDRKSTRLNSSHVSISYSVFV